MLNTSLKYVTVKTETYDYAKYKALKKITDRCFVFSVSGAKTEEEHSNVVFSFHKYLESKKITCDCFGFGSWKENMNRNEASCFMYLDISIRDMKEKEEIRAYYKEWKEKYLSTFKKVQE